MENISMTKYINADKAEIILEHIVETDTRTFSDRGDELTDKVYSSIAKGLETLKSLPAADVAEVRHGKWMDYRRMGIDGTFHWFRQCSECLYEREDDNEDKDTPYCPNCGAKMDLERSDRMTTNDGYTIIQYPTENTIVITLPQRWDSLTNTFVPVSDRRKCLSNTEEAALLATVKAMFENKVKMDEGEDIPMEYFENSGI
jgi:ssDNA-binding Zn-finger/Zn-ribbon topoisomerase 1